MEFSKTSVWGFENAIYGMRAPKQSYSMIDSYYGAVDTGENVKWDPYYIGSNDMRLMKNLVRAGGEHSKFMRMIHVQTFVTAPRYIWSEFDTYHFNTKNSESTMHKLLDNVNPITINQFVYDEEDIYLVEQSVKVLEKMRQDYMAAKLVKNGEAQIALIRRAKKILPEGFLQSRMIDTNYAELRNMYKQRKSHRLEEWNTDFVRFIKSLPYSELITGEED